MTKNFSFEGMHPDVSSFETDQAKLYALNGWYLVLIVAIITAGIVITRHYATVSGNESRKNRRKTLIDKFNQYGTKGRA